MMWLSVLTLFGMTFVIVSLGLAVGAAFPKFDADNPSKIAAGLGGLVYMVLCMSFIGVVVVLEAWPVYVLFSSRVHDLPLSPLQHATVVGSFVVALTLAVTVFIVSTRYGIRKLAAIEP